MIAANKGMQAQAHITASSFREYPVVQQAAFTVIRDNCVASQCVGVHTGFIAEFIHLLRSPSAEQALRLCVRLTNNSMILFLI